MPTARGLRLMNEVDARLGARDGAVAPSALGDLPAKLATAREELTKGHVAMQACGEKTSALRVAYSLR